MSLSMRTISTGNYKGIRYTEIDGVYRIKGCNASPAFYAFGALRAWVDNNANG